VAAADGQGQDVAAGGTGRKRQRPLFRASRENGNQRGAGGAGDVAFSSSIFLWRLARILLLSASLGPRDGATAAASGLNGRAVVGRGRVTAANSVQAYCFPSLLPATCITCALRCLHRYALGAVCTLRLNSLV